MKVSDAFKLISELKKCISTRQAIIKPSPYHADFETHRESIKNFKKEIERLEELVYNMELSDSYDKKTLEFLEGYKGGLNE